MNRLENIVYVLDDLLNTKRKRHIIGGILLSTSMLFGGLSFTVFTIRKDEDV
ncbi:MAG: histidine kinase [Clostridiaceae bacterium]|nr:histidine kinase [Clostridiaceae bacterium]